MSLDHLLTRQATLLTRSYDGPPDELGDPTWTEIETAVACELQPQGSIEAIGDQAQLSTWRVFLPASTAGAAGWDALRIDGDLYELAGDPAPAYNPRDQTVHHVEAVVTRVR